MHIMHQVYNSEVCKMVPLLLIFWHCQIELKSAQTALASVLTPSCHLDMDKKYPNPSGQVFTHTHTHTRPKLAMPIWTDHISKRGFPHLLLDLDETSYAGGGRRRRRRRRGKSRACRKTLELVNAFKQDIVNLYWLTTTVLHNMEKSHYQTHSGNSPRSQTTKPWRTLRRKSLCQGGRIRTHKVRGLGCWQEILRSGGWKDCARGVRCAALSTHNRRSIPTGKYRKELYQHVDRVVTLWKMRQRLWGLWKQEKNQVNLFLGKTAHRKMYTARHLSKLFVYVWRGGESNRLLPECFVPNDKTKCVKIYLCSENVSAPVMRRRKRMIVDRHSKASPIPPSEKRWDRKDICK